jgi:hypothetical protein
MRAIQVFISNSDVQPWRNLIAYSHPWRLLVLAVVFSFVQVWFSLGLAWGGSPSSLGGEGIGTEYEVGSECGCASCLARRQPSCAPTCVPPRLFSGGWWLATEYLYWQPKQARDLPLVTSSAAGTSAATSGVLGLNTTSVLMSSGGLSDKGMSGGRITLGAWADETRCHAWEASYFGVESETTYRTTSSTNAILARPFTNAANGTAASLLIAHPGFLNGNVLADYSLNFQGAEVGLRSIVRDLSTCKLDFLIGYRYLDLAEKLNIDSFSRYAVAQGQILAGTTKDIQDQFQVDNRFHGGQVGLGYRESMRWFDFDAQLKLAVGGTTSTTNINGRTLTTVPGGGSATLVGGLLAQSTNIGTSQHNAVSVVPELRVGLSKCLTPCIRASVGYNLIAWNQIARAADRMDTTLSQQPPQSPLGDQRPQLMDGQSTFVIQGVNVGLNFMF